MLDLIDNHIEQRLKKLLVNGEPITVYPYEPDRDKGESVYPSISFQRLYDRIDIKRVRVHHDYFIPSEEQGQVTMTPVQAMGGPTVVTGPVSWTVKPFPTPVYLVYEIDMRATVKGQANWMIASLFQAFPPGYSLLLNGQAPLFELGDPHNLDERDKPLFRRTVLLMVHDLWIERLESTEAPSITEPIMEREVMEV